MEFQDRCKLPNMPNFDCLLFDLDDTLYPLSSGIATECRKNIGNYMVEKLGIPQSKIDGLCNLLYKNYGTTMAGLRAIGYYFDYDDYHGFVHGRLPYENIKPDPALRHLLLSLPIRKMIFTNADKVHAAKVLKRLGIEDCFEGIICFETLNPPSFAPDASDKSEIFDIEDYFDKINPGVELPKTPILCKPNVEAMEHPLKMSNIDPRRTIFFDDSIRNLQSGKRIGLHTVVVGTSQRAKGTDYAIENIHNIKDVLRKLWDEDTVKSDEVMCSAKVAIETSVTA
ncbi:Haloacid dehalogenase-like hydrolase (HAD) superfamily protein [Rhynchospora pubera]|uniref:Haloacid dehalogenase-like hydrolase (HAD) superfamily protein n=1 Tax=Rhynchospora pubera TaxID=906938 RepID=A0AAV8FQ54_9POAL|nr:Haloacid dehalogenase-like hydrolase (HAD) superfamily protein [Rhynchospora pubera]KAJ4792956.1 Haloacid dehalogenase-like hydrolase (HAD) superfamily protein [Rhynchospora pubera]